MGTYSGYPRVAGTGEHLDGALVHRGDDGVERGLDVVLYGVYMKGKNEKDLSPDSNPFLQTANPCCDPLGRAIAQPHNRENFVLIMYHESTSDTRENSQNNDKIFTNFQHLLCAGGQHI